MSANQEWFDRLRRTMPGGSSTGSKAATLTPEQPAVIVRGRGCRVWDADGREYIDFRNGLGPVTLGYRFPAVDEAIRRQLDNGISFGQPHPLECEVSEALCDAVPCYEQAKFLKTGGEACAACLRIARSHTDKEHVIQIGYNGWLNSLARGALVLPGQATAAIPRGVPPALSALHHMLPWNDVAAVERVFDATNDQVAAVLVAANYEEMAAGRSFYPALRELTRRRGALLIHDEIVTGFRIAIGGAQEYFGVTPDLAVFAKGVANGMPLSVYGGRREVMAACDVGRGLSISSTYGGETLSLAAARAVLTTYREQNVIDHLWRQGKAMWRGLNDILARHGVPMRLRGLWPCPRFVEDDGAPPDIKARVFRAAFRHGVALFNVPYITFSHGDADVAEALELLDKAVAEL